MFSSSRRRIPRLEQTAPTGPRTGADAGPRIWGGGRNAGKPQLYRQTPRDVKKVPDKAPAVRQKRWSCIPPPAPIVSPEAFTPSPTPSRVKRTLNWTLRFLSSLTATPTSQHSQREAYFTLPTFRSNSSPSRLKLIA